MTDSWDLKIERAHKLAREDSPAREVLELYLKVAEFQKFVFRNLNGAAHTDIRLLPRFLPELRKLLKNLGAAPLEAAARELGEDPERWNELLLKHWEQDAK